MMNLCSKCSKPLEDGDKIKFEANGVYHVLKSVKSWALEKNSLEADVDSLRHVDCYGLKGD